MRALEVRGAILVLRAVRTFTVGLWIGVLLCVVPGRAVSNPAEISSPRPVGWVLDEAKLLEAADRVALDRLGDAVHAANAKAALFIVTVESTGAANSRGVATGLLNRWGPNGSLSSAVMIFVARSDRKAELVLGDDLLRQHGTSASDRIMRDTIVTSMRRRDPRSALVLSARECAQKYFSLTVDDDGRVARYSAPRPSGAAATNIVDGVATPSSTTTVAVPLPDLERPTTSAESTPVADSSASGGATDAGPTSAPAAAIRDPRNTNGSAGGMFLVLFGGLAAVGGVVFAVIKASGPRKCPRCHQPMLELGPAEEQPHLAAGERTEERVGSVNYKIWHCAPCGHFEKTRHGRFFSGFSACPQCRAETRREIKRTLRAATTFSGGLVEVTEHCEHCGYHHVSTHSTPRVRESSHTSRGSFGGGGSRGGGSGRSSSGGGSSGSW